MFLAKKKTPTGLPPFANAHRPHAATQRCGRLLRRGSTPGGRLPYGERNGTPYRYFAKDYSRPDIATRFLNGCYRFFLWLPLPDMTNVTTYGTNMEEAKLMAKEVAKKEIQTTYQEKRLKSFPAVPPKTNAEIKMFVSIKIFIRSQGNIITCLYSQLNV